jgi:hypothetical protein
MPMSVAKRTRRNFDQFEDPGPIYRSEEIGDRLFGALVMAAIAYPEAKFASRRLEMALRLQARNYGDSIAETAGWVVSESQGKRVLLPLNTRTLDSGWSQLESRLQHRQVFGLLALQPLLSAETNEPPLSQWGGRWNRAEAIRKAMGADDLSDRRNFERTYWRPSLAVAHLAAAWVAELIVAKKRGPAPDIDAIVGDGDLLTDLLARAERFEPLVEASELRIPQSILIKFRT